ncbi:MAG: ferrous iron transport protein A [Candidatus Methanomethylophilus sp.]|nr:ferrous iron transport protein A [Methanomethylophilus sp.]
MQFGDLKVGDSAVILNVGGEGQLRKRLLDLGVTKGTKVTMVRIAPFGDPIEIQLRGYRLTLRKSEAAIVEIGPAEVSE